MYGLTKTFGGGGGGRIADAGPLGVGTGNMICPDGFVSCLEGTGVEIDVGSRNTFGGGGGSCNTTTGSDCLRRDSGTSRIGVGVAGASAGTDDLAGAKDLVIVGVVVGAGEVKSSFGRLTVGDEAGPPPPL